MAIPLAALGRTAGAGITRMGASEAAAARSAVGGRGDLWRSAMQEARGNKQIAREMVTRKAHEVREEQREARRHAAEEARENARQMREQQQAARRQGGGGSGGYLSQFKQGIQAGNYAVGVEITEDIQQRIVQNDFRGLATRALPDILGRMVSAVGKTADAIEERAQHLSRHSGTLSAATAGANSRQMLADIYESQVVGRSYGDVVTKLSEIQTDLQTTTAPIKAEIAKMISDLLDGLKGYLPGKDWGEKVADVLAQIRIGNQQLAHAITDPKNAGKHLGEDFNKRVDQERQMRQMLKELAEMEARDPFGAMWDLPELQLPPERAPAPLPDDGMRFKILG